MSLWALFFLAGASHSQCELVESQKLLPQDPTQALQEYGFALAMSGDLLIVGIPNDDTPIRGSGTASVYRFDGARWCFEQQLFPLEPVLDLFFGHSVATNGQVVVASTGRPSVPYAAIVFRYDGLQWVREQVLTPTAEGGSVLAASSDRILVGNDGLVFVYGHDGMSWVIEQTLSPSDGTVFENTTLSIYDNLIAVGNKRDDDACPQNPLCDSGSVYVFRHNGTMWVEEQKIASPVRDDFFGDAVSIHRDMLAVRSTFSPILDIYRYDNSWLPLSQIPLPPNAHDFGRSLALDRFRNTLYVGAPGSIGEVGLVLTYRFNGADWLLDETLEPSDGDGTANDAFGYSLAASHDRLIVGAPGNDEGSALAVGAVYSFERPLSCETGSVNEGAGSTTDVLTVNGSTGGEERLLRVGLGDSLAFGLAAAAAGPSPGKYVLYAWNEFPSRCSRVLIGPESLGCLVNPTPFRPSQIPQPFKHLRSPGLPQRVGRGVPLKPSPPSAPFLLELHRGIETPSVVVLQGVIEDEGDATGLGYSITNAITIIAQ